MKRRFVLLAALALARSPHADETGASTTSLARLTHPLAAVRLEDLAVTRERPLFSPTRRPPPAAAASAPSPVSPPPAVEAKVAMPDAPDLDLMGTVVGRFRAYALLRNRANNAVTRVRKGDEHEGWRVGKVGLRSVTLMRNGRMKMLRFAGSARPDPQLAGAVAVDQSRLNAAPTGSRRPGPPNPPP